MLCSITDIMLHSLTCPQRLNSPHPASLIFPLFFLLTMTTIPNTNKLFKKKGNVIFETTAKANESDKYDWKKRVAVSLSPTEVADLLIHLESGSSYSVSKTVRLPREWTPAGGYSDQEGAEYNVALTVTGHKKGNATFELAKDDEKPIATEMTAPELYVFKRCMDFSLPYLTGFAGVITE